MQEGHDSGAKVWWYANGSQQQGPISAQELKRIAAEGGLQPDALLWREGMAEWIAASSVRGLLPAAEVTLPVPPPVPPPPPPAAAAGGWGAPTAPETSAPPAWAAASAAGDDAPWFAVSTRKLLVMSFCTLTFYNLYWLYQNWVKIKQRDRSDIMPIMRTIFSIFFVHGLFSRVRDDALAAGLRPSYSAGLLTGLYIVVALSWKLPEPWDWISALVVLVFMPVQALANQVNASVAPAHDRNDRYSGLNITGIVFGGLLMVMTVLGSFMIEEEEPEEPRRRPSSSAPVALAVPGSLQA